MTADALLVDRADGVAVLRLNRPEALNALSRTLVRALITAVDDARRDPWIGCVVITGMGRAFCAGGDLKEMPTMSADEFRDYILLLQGLSSEMRRLAKPTIAAVNGYALAGGMELAVMCDVRIAAEEAVFGLPDTALGLSPTSGMTYLLPRIVGMGWARHLTLTGESIDARFAERIGLVTRVVPAADLEVVALQMAQTIAGYPRLGVHHVKVGFDVAADADFSTALTYEIEAETACFATDEFQAALRAFAQRKKDRPQT